MILYQRIGPILRAGVDFWCNTGWGYGYEGSRVYGYTAFQEMIKLPTPFSRHVQIFRLNTAS